MPTTDSLKATLQAQIAPGNDEEFLRLLTEADMRLLEFGRWQWTRKRVTLTPVDHVVTLTAAYAAILGARVDEYPVETVTEDFEFVPGGPGEIEVGGSGGVRLIDQGLNDSGLRHYKATGMTDGTTYPVYAICHYAPFTLYYTVDLPDSPAANESASTRCPVVGALKQALLAIYFEEESDEGRAAIKMATALRILDNQEKTKRGNARTSTNLWPWGAGVSGVRSFR